MRIELHTREAAPPRSRRPPGGHDTGRERGGCGRAPGSVAGAAATAAAALLLVDPETQDEWRRKEMPKKSRALGPPQAMMKRTFSAPQARKFFAAVLCKKASSTKGMVTPWLSQKVPESTQQKSNHWNVSGADGQRKHVKHRSNHFNPPWAAARQRWRGYACWEALGTRLRAKEAKKAYPVRLKKCRPHRARPFGAGLERQHGRRASPTADSRGNG